MKNYLKIYSDLQSEVIENILNILKEDGIDHSIEDEEKLEFFDYEYSWQSSLTKITKEGNFVMGDGYKIYSLRDLVDTNDLSLVDAIGLLEELKYKTFV